MPSLQHTKWPVAIMLGVVGSIAVALVVLAFLWPTKTSATHDLPLSIAGPAAQTSTLEKTLDQRSPDAVDFVAADDRADAVQQIKTRATYGAIVLPTTAGGAPEVLTAPAASSAVTPLLTTIAGELQTQLTQQITAAGGDASAVQVKTTAVVPLSSDDATGSGLAAAAFPMTMGGMLGGILLSLLVVGPMRRLAGLLGFAVATGLIVTIVLQPWFHFLQGDYWINALAIGLSVLATSAFIVGCTSLLGRAGVAIGAVLTLLVGSPLSSAAAPWQFLPAPWGAIGQYLVPGASNWLIRSLSYFPDSDTSVQWLVLTGWAALGVALTLAGHFRSRAELLVPTTTIEQPTTAPASV